MVFKWYKQVNIHNQFHYFFSPHQQAKQEGSNHTVPSPTVDHELL